MKKDKLKKEWKFFQRKKKELLKRHGGKFVLIKEEKIVGFFSTPTNAYKEGVKRFGNSPFLVKQILKEESLEEIPALTLGLINAHL